MGMATAASTPMMATTIINSSSEKPPSRAGRRQTDLHDMVNCRRASRMPRLFPVEGTDRGTRDSRLDAPLRNIESQYRHGTRRRGLQRIVRWRAVGVVERTKSPQSGFSHVIGIRADVQAFRCLFTSLVISNMLTWALPPNTVFRLSSALIIRRFLAS